MPPQQHRIIEGPKFTYSSLGKAIEKQTKPIEKQTKSIEKHGEKQVEA